MPKLVPVQESFAAGELSPRMLARVGTKGYKEGAARLENLIPFSQGPAQRRPGFTFGSEIPEANSQVKLIAFPTAIDDYFLIVFTHLKMWVFNKLGEIQSPEYALNAEFNQGGANWTGNPGSGASVTYSGTAASLVSSPSRTIHIYQNITGLAIGKTYRFRVVQLSPNDNLRLRVGTTAGGAELGEITSNTSTPQVQFVATAVSHYVDVAMMDVGPTAVITTASVQEVVPTTGVASPFTADVLSRIQYEIEPSGTVMYICSDDFPVQSVTYSAGAFTLAAAIFTSPPAEWTGTNFPRTVTFFGGRSWFGGTKSTPAKFWGSKSGLYLDFTVGTAADAALAYTIAKRGAIRWMLGGKNLLIGTEVQEFVVNGSQGFITPTDINIEPQSAYGSLLIQPASLGNLILYVSGDGRKLYSMGYRFEESGWVSTDLSFASEHISFARIVVLAYAQSPESIVWMLDTQGRLLGCSYERGNNVVGWHRHPSQLYFLSLTTAKFLGTNHLWAAWRVERDADTFIQLGIIPRPDFLGPYPDAHKRVIAGAPQTVFSGFEHLRNEVVQVLADASVHPNVTVSSGGTITLQYPATEIVAGLGGNNARLLSMPFEPGQPGQGSQAAFKRFNKAYVQVLASAKPLVNGTRAPDRTPSTPMNLRELPITGKLFSVDLGWSLTEVIDIEEDLPVELTILGIFGELGMEQT